ncbi:uncharacterized protein LTR77_006659 [Saxophila tyrrhenica]|uniref:NADAR domain-containing protein n=1 Tax=Saxophila tyrrhenica TaxID=1690608 RepID=A0AAV9P9L4_9PEZI|nr:hypothetical protein LTR77_006659 [Saxophila tyrrhenica]
MRKNNCGKRTNQIQQARPTQHITADVSEPTRSGATDISEAIMAYVPSSNYSDKPLFFFKEDEENGIFCQWYRCHFTDPQLDGLTFNCAEQYMMYHKAMTFNDRLTAGLVMKATSPCKQKGFGQQIAGFDGARWNQVKSTVVQRGNYLKFTQCNNAASFKADDVGEPAPLKGLLLATGERELAEASHFDRVWGIGFRADVALGVPRSRWGENLLGKALMHVRGELQREAEAQ